MSPYIITSDESISRSLIPLRIAYEIQAIPKVISTEKVDKKAQSRCKEFLLFLFRLSLFQMRVAAFLKILNTFSNIIYLILTEIKVYFIF